MAGRSPTSREFLFDLIKIVEGALNYDRAKVVAYANHLRTRLELAGEAEVAKRLGQLLAGQNGTTVEAARLATPLPNVPVDSESRLPIADREFIDPTTASVVLPTSAQRTVEQLIAAVKGADRLAAHGLPVAPSMLIFGEPGCGKTTVARFIAAALSLPLVTARSDALISSYLGSTAKNIRALFDFAMSGPCVLFLDEFDAIGKMRDDSQELGELKRVVISLLQNIDAMGSDHVLLAATNHEHLLDPAIWRRFTYRTELGRPDESGRRAILKTHFRGRASDEVLDVVARMTEGLSGSDCAQLAHEIVRSAVLMDEPNLSTSSIMRHILLRRGVDVRDDSTPLADRIRAMRDHLPRGTTQQEIADAVGLSQSQVSRYLRGGRRRGPE